MELIIDDREQKIIPYIQSYHNDHEEKLIPYKVKRLEVGDYAINYRGYILLIIERKTWVDLAASLRDGRKANINKLLHVREHTGCQLIYMIEGPAFPTSTRKFGRMPAKNLIAHLDHIAFRDGIHIQHTASHKHTARRLFELATNYATIKNPSLLKEIDDLIKTGGNQEDETSILTEKQASQINIQEQILQCLPSVGSVVSGVLQDNGVSFASLFFGQHGEGQLAQLTYADGRKIGLKRAKKILANIRMLKGKSQLAGKITIRILSEVKGISAKTAKMLADVYTINQLMTTTSIGDLREFSRGKSKLGPTASKTLIESIRNSQKIDEQTK